MGEELGRRMGDGVGEEMGQKSESLTTSSPGGGTGGSQSCWRQQRCRRHRCFYQEEGRSPIGFSMHEKYDVSTTNNVIQNYTYIIRVWRSVEAEACEIIERLKS